MICFQMARLLDYLKGEFMNSKKLNLFALFMMIVMCAVTIFVSVRRKDNDSAVTDETLSI